LILGLLSDTHLSGPDEGLETLLAGPLGPAEVLLHAGDHTGEAVVDHLEFVDPRPYWGVAGNMDGPAVRRRLPRVRTLDLEGCRIGLVHGWGSPHGLEARVLDAFPEAPDLLVFGHSHRPTDLRRGSTRLVNPGSAFDRRWAPRRTVALVELRRGRVAEVRFVEVGG